MRTDYLLNSGNLIIQVFFKVKFNEFRGEEGLDSRDRMDEYWTLDTGEWILETGDWSVEGASYEKEERRERGRTCGITVEWSTTVFYDTDNSSLI